MTCNQVENLSVITEELEAAHKIIAEAFPWLGEDDIKIMENVKKDSGGCIYEHEGYNCDVYTDGYLFSSKIGKSCKDFGFCFILDRDDDNKVRRIEFVINNAQRRNMYKEMLDPGVLALMA